MTLEEAEDIFEKYILNEPVDSAELRIAFQIIQEDVDRELQEYVYGQEEKEEGSEDQKADSSTNDSPQDKEGLRQEERKEG